MPHGTSRKQTYCMTIALRFFFCAIVLIPLLLVVPDRYKRLASLALTLGIAVASIALAYGGYREGLYTATVAHLSLIGPVTLQIDSLSAIFMVIVSITVSTASVYAAGYMQKHQDKKLISIYWVSLPLLQAAMVLVCMTQEILPFVFFWEIMTLCSFVQVLLDNSDYTNAKAAWKYLVYMHVQVVVLLLVWLAVGITTGVYTMEGIKIYFGLHSNFWMFVLFFVSFGMKAGFVPFHTWLPHADPAAPCPSSGIMSGAMIKIGLYGIFRILTFIRTDLLEIGIFIYSVAMVTGLYGIINAAVQKDIKKVLAYSTIENAGLIGMALGLGVMGMAVNSELVAFLGLAGALLHTINHSLIKPLLFYTAGSVYNRTGVRNMDRLGGLARKMPFTAFLFLMGALAMCGLPPFNGFVSEFLIYSGMIGLLHAGFSIDILELLGLVVLALMGGISIYTFTRAFATIFLGRPRSEQVQLAVEADVFQLVPGFFLMAFVLLIGLMPEVFIKTIAKAVSLYMPVSPQSVVVYEFDTFFRIGLSGVLFIGIAALVYLIRSFFVKKNTETYVDTWGCGYKGTDHKFQYTASSFSENFRQLVQPLIARKEKFKKYQSEELFPTDRKLQTRIDDTIEQNGVQKIVKKLTEVMMVFARTQDGDTQNYILYAFLFIMILLTATVFNIL
jgi:hydrogenase-4 component B